MNRLCRWMCAVAVFATAVFVAPVSAQLSPFESRTYERGELKVTVGAARMVMRGPMFPWAMLFDDGSIIAIASAAKEDGPRTYIRSTDRGETWKPFEPPTPDYALPNVQLPDGTAINSSDLPKPIADRPGYYKTKRFESKDRGQTGTVTEGELYLPPEICPTQHAQHFHGNTIRTKKGELVTVMQGMEAEAAPDWPEAWKTPFKCYFAKSTDDGKTWKYASHVASIRDVTGESAKALKTGWNLWGACEPSLMEVGDGKLVCVMRSLNDTKKPLIGEPTDTYRDTRGFPLVLYEKPFCDLFIKKHGVDPNEIKDDDPRIAEVRADIVTTFFKELRAKLDEIEQSRGDGKHVEISAMVLGNDASNRQFGVDVRRLVKEKLLDAVQVYKGGFGAKGGYDADFFRDVCGKQGVPYQPTVNPPHDLKGQLAHAVKLYESGAPGISFWDAARTSNFTWFIQSRLGHADETRWRSENLNVEKLPRQLHFFKWWGAQRMDVRYPPYWGG